MPKLTVEQRKFWNVIKYEYDRNKVLKTNKDVIRAIKISKRLNKVVEPLGTYIINIATRVASQKNWNRYVYLDDMIAHAVMFMVKSIMRFDPTKSNNPRAYLKTCCNSSFANYINHEKKQHTLKVDLQELIKNGQVD